MYTLVLNTVLKPSYFYAFEGGSSSKKKKVVAKCISEKTPIVVGTILNFLKGSYSIIEDNVRVYFFAGPGSFTGIKISFALLKGFFGKEFDKVCKGLNLLEVALRRVSSNAVFLKAHQGDYFVGLRLRSSFHYFVAKSFYAHKIFDKIGEVNPEDVAEMPVDAMVEAVLENLDSFKFYGNPLYLKMPVIGKKRIFKGVV